MARLRSKTAAHCIGGIESDYAGTDSDSDKPVTKSLMDWADKIVCMENFHRSKLRRRFKGYSHKMTVWNIPDDYGYMDDLLVVRLRRNAEKEFDNGQQ